MCLCFSAEMKYWFFCSYVILWFRTKNSWLLRHMGGTIWSQSWLSQKLRSLPGDWHPSPQSFPLCFDMKESKATASCVEDSVVKDCQVCSAYAWRPIRISAVLGNLRLCIPNIPGQNLFTEMTESLGVSCGIILIIRLLPSEGLRS